ncbi:MAG: MGMT family protein [Candidatus Dormibacteria bacterium]
MVQSAQPRLAEAVERVLRATLPGDLLTYGEVATLAGHRGGARAVGHVLAQSQGLPWWRVVNSQGRLVPGHELRQTELLRREGVRVLNGRCQMRRASVETLCQPEEVPQPRPGASQGFETSR